RSAILDWGNASGSGRERLALVRELLTLRQRHIMPRLKGVRFGDARVTDNGLLAADWRFGDGAGLSLTANLSDRTLPGLPGEIRGTPIWGTPRDATAPWSVLWRLEAR